uniref:GNAT family N-acetyltransferase n=1 Tax=Phenylobacterium glaciei TaxID=2803784 RepID=A0A974P130_9CAUL|nr:GNAT family N-acetyltransferase [Phenylobacterium glaciei]
MVGSTQIEAIERATLAAVAPEEVLEIDGWLIGLDPGSIRRAASAVPLRHDLPVDAAVLDHIEAAYAERGLKPAFRIADGPGLESVRGELARRGYGFEQPTLVKTAVARAVTAVTDLPPAEIAERPDDAWAAVFLGRVRSRRRRLSGQGAEPLARRPVRHGARWRQDHRRRLRILWPRLDQLSRHAHRPQPPGRGLAGRVLAGLVGEAMSRGIDRAFLQVEEKNAPARSLYRRAGFTQAWRYFYWSKPS